MQASSVSARVRARVSARVPLGALFGGVMVTTLTLEVRSCQIEVGNVFPPVKVCSQRLRLFRFVSSIHSALLKQGMMAGRLRPPPTLACVYTPTPACIGGGLLIV